MPRAGVALSVHHAALSFLKQHFKFHNKEQCFHKKTCDFQCFRSQKPKDGIICLCLWHCNMVAWSPDIFERPLIDHSKCPPQHARHNQLLINLVKSKGNRNLSRFWPHSGWATLVLARSSSVPKNGTLFVLLRGRSYSTATLCSSMQATGQCPQLQGLLLNT